MTGSYCGFLLKAGHVWRTSWDPFLQVHNWNSKRGKPCGDRMDLWAFMYQKGIAKVSLRATGIALGLARMWKKGTLPSFACKHEWTNCISTYCKVSLLVVHHIAFHGLEPLFKTKERLTTRLLQQHFSRFGSRVLVFGWWIKSHSWTNSNSWRW